jgi:hypothetical protein
MEISIGADPEFFLTGPRNKRTSAHNLVPGTKREPFKLNKGALQADGTAVEFNIDPAKTPQEFASNIQVVLNQIRDRIPGEYKFEFLPTIHYGRDYFAMDIPESAKELGCEPDFNAWDGGDMNPRPVAPQAMRTGSGHLHIGWTEGADIKDPVHLEDCMAIVRRLDYYFRPICPLWETPEDATRRRLYGKWGCFRPKSYGVEYRVLGNTWLRYPKLWPWMFQYVSHAVDSLERGTAEDQLVVKPVMDHTGAKINVNASLPYPILDTLTSAAGMRQYYFERIVTGTQRTVPKGAPMPTLDMLGG